MSKPGYRHYSGTSQTKKAEFWFGGIRHRGGVTIVQALMWNWGNCRSDVKGAVRVENPQESEYRCGAQWRSHA